MRTVWLASYPKSGNTWFRIFLANLLHPELIPVDPNRIPLNNLIASARGPFQEILGFPSSLLTDTESAALRPVVDRIIGRDWPGEICLRKAHDAYTYSENGVPLMGSGPDFAAIYILRDPWDVAISAANHWNQTPQEAVSRMGKSTFTLNRTGRSIAEQFPERLMSWHEHAISWLEAPMDVHLMRYESMQTDALPTFRSAVRFLGLPHDDSQIEAAIESSKFSRLQKIEDETGFREAPRSRRFFRKGIVGDGLQVLSTENLEILRQQLARVEETIAYRTRT